MWLLAAIIAIPLIEIALFIMIGGWLSLWPTLALVVGTAVAGISVVRLQGRLALLDLRRAVDEMRDPAAPLAHGALLLMAGFLLLMPGFLTDAIGILLLIPAFRTFVMRQVATRVKVTRVETRGYARPARDQIIEGEYHDAADEPDRGEKRPTHRPSGWTRH
ncbi:FxsA family protein [Halodurantibacterium flavum]|uniref:FxsA family protein n=1 Tax=Halodurantibacterium flavum TaxID=1382802 RepID=A0ABW4S7U6_9RHOB